MKTKNKLFTLLALGLAFSNTLNAKTENKDTLESKTKDIVVTALRYPESIYEAPLSLTRINYSSIKNYIGNGFDNALSMTPGVFSQMRSGTPDMKITIRGFGARGAGDRSNSGTTRGIKLILDGVPETEPDGRTSFDNIDMAFVNDIEVVRSNSSAIWGNAAGGVISINTMPDAKEEFAKIDFLGGAFGLKKSALTLFSPLSEGAIVANFSATNFDGYRKNSEGEKYTGNIGMTGKLDSKTTFKANLTGGVNKYYIPGPLTEAQFDADPEQANATYEKREERRHNRTLRIALGIDRKFDENNTLSAEAYANPKFLQRSERGTFRDFTRYHVGGSAAYKNTIKFSDSFSNTALFGIDEAYQDGAILFYNLSADNGRGTLKENKKEAANSFGAYFQDELNFGDNWSLLLGARYDRISYYSDMFYSGEDTRRLPYETKTFDRITPKAALSYRFNPFHSVYLSYGGGVEVPAGNETNPTPDQPNLQINALLDPIISTTYELGTKQLIEFDNSILNSINYDAAMYYIEVKNELTPYEDGKYFFSAAKTQRFGFELAAEFKVCNSIYWKNAFTLVSGKYGDYKIDSVHYDAGKAGKFADYSDNKIAGIPDYYFNTALKFAPNNLYGLFAEISAQGVGSYYADDANKYEADSYAIFNLSFGMDEYLQINDFLSFRAYAQINNLSDEKYASSCFINPSLDKKTKAPMYLEPGLPRNVSVGFSVKFD
jgi:iron complex outermembrane receptor protein